MINGEQYVSAELASIIFSAMLAAVLLASALMLKERTGTVQLTGLSLALADVLLRESAVVGGAARHPVYGV